MDTIALIALFAAAAANSAVPGPCIVLTLSRSAVEGIAAGLRVTFGIALADLTLLAVAWAAIFGAVTLSESFFAALKTAGIVAIALIALALLRDPPAASGTPPSRRTLGPVTAGLWLGLASPLNLVFMLALLPQFRDAGGATAGTAALVTGVVLLGSARPLAAASALGAGALRRAPGGGRWIGGAGGIALLGFAGLAALSPA
jgi:threonine/homoserine/homoserine lactone efflux protein